MATNEMDRAFVTPLELAHCISRPLPLRDFCLISAEEANGGVDTDALFIINVFVTRSYTAVAAQYLWWRTAQPMLTLPIVDKATLIAVDFPVCDGPLATTVGHPVV